jgi:hypothetical protein
MITIFLILILMTSQSRLRALRLGQRRVGNKSQKSLFVVAKQFEMTFNINTNIPKEEMTSQNREATRSFAAQGKRCDSDLCKAERLPYRSDEQIADSINKLKLRIDNDRVLRMKIAKPVLTASSSALPARILKSQLHRYAYTVAVQNGEIDQAMLGNRTRRDYHTEE